MSYTVVVKRNFLKLLLVLHLQCATSTSLTQCMTLQPNQDLRELLLNASGARGNARQLE